MIDDFIDWCIENVEFWQDDRTPEEYMIIDHLEKCRNKQYVDVIKDYDVIFLWYNFYNHWYIDNYRYNKSLIIPRSLRAGEY